MKKLSKSDADKLEKPLKDLKKHLDGTDPARIKTACDQLQELLGYADKGDGTYDSNFTK